MQVNPVVGSADNLEDQTLTELRGPSGSKQSENTAP